MGETARRILLVDDEPTVVKMVKKRLEVSGFEVVVAVDGEEALAKAAGARFDAVVLDLMLPKMNGMDVCATLKQNQSYNDIPIVVIFSGKGQPEDEEQCRRLGAAAYVSKSQGAVHVIEQINALLGPGNGT